MRIHSHVLLFYIEETELERSFLIIFGGKIESENKSLLIDYQHEFIASRVKLSFNVLFLWLLAINWKKTVKKNY